MVIKKYRLKISLECFSIFWFIDYLFFFNCLIFDLSMFNSELLIFFNVLSIWVIVSELNLLINLCVNFFDWVLINFFLERIGWYIDVCFFKCFCNMFFFINWFIMVIMVLKFIVFFFLSMCCIFLMDILFLFYKVVIIFVLSGLKKWLRLVLLNLNFLIFIFDILYY